MIPQNKILIYKFPARATLGGLEQYLLKLVEGLHGEGQETLLLTSCPFAFSEFKKRGFEARKWWAGYEPIGQKRNLLYLLLSPIIFFSLLGSLIYFRKRGFNKILCATSTEKYLVTPLARYLGLKVYWLEVFDVDRLLAKSWRKNLYLRLAPRARIITISSYLKNQLTTLGVPDKNITVVYEGIDLTLYRQQLDMFAVMAEKNFIVRNQKQFVVGFVGKLEKEKGLHTLIKSFDILTKEFSDLSLVLVGEGSERKNLEWLIKNYNLERFIRLVGYKESLLRWIWGFDVFVLPSTRESLGITAIQAAACSKPVIATNIGGLPEVVSDQETGLIVPVEDSLALAQAIKTIYKDKLLAIHLGDHGRAKIERDFSLEKMQRKIFEVFAE